MQSKEMYETRSKNLDKLVWNRERDTYLRSLVDIYGDAEWTIVSDCMNSKFGEPNRTGKQCKDRWRAVLEPGGSRQSWTDRDRYLLLVAHRKFKNRWSEVALMLKKRSSNTIKNRFYTLFRKVKNKIKNADFITSSALDLLEIYYILSLIEEYQQSIAGKPAAFDLSDKNYAHKLVQQIDPQSVATFRDKLTELHRDEGTLSDLFSQYADTFGIRNGKPKLRAKPPAEKKEEPMCNDIDFVEPDNEPIATQMQGQKITLPVPTSFDHSSGISNEDKDNFWRFVFQKRKEPQSTREDCKSSLPSVRSPPRSVECTAMRDDEGCGFSQFVCEAGQDLLPVPAPAVLPVPPFGEPALTIPLPAIGSAFRPVVHSREGSELPSS